MGLRPLWGGTATWQFLGSALEVFGIKVFPVFWGIMAALTYTVGGLLYILGILFRPVCFFLLLTMVVAIAYHLHRDDSLLKVTGHSLALGMIFLSSLFMGPGQYSFGKNG